MQTKWALRPGTLKGFLKQWMFYLHLTCEAPLPGKIWQPSGPLSTMSRTQSPDPQNQSFRNPHLPPGMMHPHVGSSSVENVMCYDPTHSHAPPACSFTAVLVHNGQGFKNKHTFISFENYHIMFIIKQNIHYRNFMGLPRRFSG